MTTDAVVARIRAAIDSAFGPDVSVLSIEPTSIGTGQVGENIRCEITWSAADEALPRTVVAKMPSTSDISRATAVQLDTYTKEIGFYRDIRAHVDVRVPHLHALEWDPTTHDFLLVMEDVAPADQGDQLMGCDPEQAAMAVDQAAALHAPMWGRTGEFADLEWLEQPGQRDGADLRAEMMKQLGAAFVERYRDRLSADDLALTNVLADGYVDWQRRLADWGAQHGWCVTHGDYRLDNMLFGRHTASPLTVVDWQTVGLGVGPVDVAYFCGAGLMPDVRVANERQLVQRYVAELQSRGVDLSEEAAWDAYALGSGSGYVMAVLASQIVERTERGDEMFAVMAERHAAQMRHVGLVDLLTGG